MQQFAEHVIVIHKAVSFKALKWFVDLRDRLEVSQKLILDELFYIGRLAPGHHRPNHVGVLIILR
jgi:hypothetical protein